MHNYPNYPLTGGIDDIRLAGSSQSHSGRVEVKHTGIWGSICDDGWDHRESTVICRQLGYQTGYAIGPDYFTAGRTSTYSPGTGEIWLAGVQCSGTEGRFDECEFQYGWGETGECDHEEDALVFCQGLIQGKCLPPTPPPTPPRTNEQCDLRPYVSRYMVNVS